MTGLNESDVLQARLRRFYDDGACMLDEMELEQWATLFTDDALYTVVSRENHDNGFAHATIYCEGIGMIRDRVMAIRGALIFEDRYLRHLVSGVRVNRQEAGVVHSQASFLIVESIAERASEVVMVGRYLDELNDGEDGFAIRKRLCVFDNYWTSRSVIIPA